MNFNYPNLEFFVGGESGVIELFDRFYDVLGFDKPSIYEGGFPDGHVYRNNRKLKVEFEYTLSGLWIHYIFARASGWMSYGSGFIKRKNNIWIAVCTRDCPKFVKGTILDWEINCRRWATEIESYYDENIGNGIFDPENKLFSGDGGVCGFKQEKLGRWLICKSLQNELDLVVCWRNDRKWISDNLVKDGIQIIELEKELNVEKLNQKNVYFCIFCNTHKTVKNRTLMKYKTFRKRIVPICDKCFNILNGLV